MIDQRAVIDAAAELQEDVHVGPFAVIGPQVSIDSGTWIGPHTVINGPTRIGRDNRIYQFASIGDAPQDKKYAGEPTRLEIGNRNVIREYVTVNRGTVQHGGVTRVGDDNWIMAYAHIAHDCRIGNETVFSNGASVAGHVAVDDCAILGGFTLVHQFCAIGAHAFCAFGSVISKDVPPFVMVSGNPAHVQGLNNEGLKRHGFPETARTALRRAYRTIYRSGLTLQEAQQHLQEQARESADVEVLLSFLTRRERGIVR
ncbi:MAG: acyl-ACP--UDP-N-acetylglucosamine O-acyltransferase [Gammaproteobacteria bacterium]